MKELNTCPVCAQQVEFERFSQLVFCPHCSSALQTEHECYESVEHDYCEDWLIAVPIGPLPPPTPHKQKI